MICTSFNPFIKGSAAPSQNHIPLIGGVLQDDGNAVPGPVFGVHPLQAIYPLKGLRDGRSGLLQPVEDVVDRNPLQLPPENAPHMICSDFIGDDIRPVLVPAVAIGDLPKTEFPALHFDTEGGPHLSGNIPGIKVIDEVLQNDGEGIALGEIGRASCRERV